MISYVILCCSLIGLFITKWKGSQLVVKIKLTAALKKQMQFINPKESLLKQAESYWKEKIIYTLTALAIVSGLSCVMELSSLLNGQEKIEILERPKTGEGSQVFTLYAGTEESETLSGIQITVSEKKPTEEQAKEKFTESYQWLKETILGENKEFEAIMSPLQLPSFLEQTGCFITWYSNNVDLISYDGSIYPEKITEPSLVTLSAHLEYGEYKEIQEFNVILLPKNIMDGTFTEQVRAEVQKAEQEQPEINQIRLPESVQNQKVWFQKEEPLSESVFILLAFISAVGVFFLKDQKIKQEAEQKQDDLKMSYSEIIMKLLLLLNAGMTIRGAWEKITDHYKNTNARQFAYEEMELVQYQMQRGISEKQAYREFGKRCGLRSYRKLASILEQNLSKGNKGLSLLLEEEVRQALEERKNYALKKGEEAATKLLVPMFLMLAVVLVICIAPAMLSFGGLL